MNRALLLALTLVATAGTLEAQDVLTSDPTLPTTRAGTRGAAFLALGVGARAQALGGAYGAMADDISALYWNSAGIAQIDGFSAWHDDSAAVHRPGHPTHLHRSRAADRPHTTRCEREHPRLGRYAVAERGVSERRLRGRAGPAPRDVQLDRAVDRPAPWPSHYRPAHVRGARSSSSRKALPEPRPRTWRWTWARSSERVCTASPSERLSRTSANNGEFRGQLLSAQINTGDSEAQGLGNFVRVVEATAATNDLELPTVFRFSVMADLIGSATAMVSPNPDQSLRVLWDINDAIDTDIQDVDRTRVRLSGTWRFCGPASAS